MSGQKPTNTEHARRVDVIYRMLSCSSTRTQILQYSAEKWGMTERTTDSYIRRARNVILAQLEKDRESVLSDELSLRDEIVRQCMAKGQYQTALNAAEARARLCGLNMTLDQALKLVTYAGYNLVHPESQPNNATHNRGTAPISSNGNGNHELAAVDSISETD